MQAMTIENQHTLRGEIQRNEPMAKHTSWRAGGVAEVFYKPVDIDDLSLFLSQLNDTDKVYFVGLGSNLLVRDAGVPVVICTNGVLNSLEIKENQQMTVGVGVPSPKLARYSTKNGLSGAEFLCGIPGTFGGALAMNAGALGGETWDVVKEVTVINKHGQCHIYKKEDFEIAYRSVKAKPELGFTLGKDAWFIDATLQLKVGDVTESEKKIKSHLARRASTQPTQLPNAGSVFRNPENDYAARLIESAGLKGSCIGGACISEKHANFIINNGTATAHEIESLIKKIQQVVEKKHGIYLMQEVRIVGKSLNDD